MKWPFRSEKGKECSSRPGGFPPTVSADQPAVILRNASQVGTAIPVVVQQPAQMIQSSLCASNRINKYGLFLLNPQTTLPDDIETEETFSLDIVALHGICGDAYDTWTHENGKFWLRDFIPKEFPGARIFSFGYPAEVFCSLGTGHLDSFARSLLESLKCERRRKEVGDQFTLDP